MKPKKIALAILTTCCHLALSSQGISRDYGQVIPNTQFATSGAEGVMTELWLKSLGKPINPFDESLIQGSPYFDKTFRKGEIFYNDEKTPRIYYLRYNAFRDLIEVKNSPSEEEAPLELLKSINISCRIENKVFHYKSFKDSDGKQGLGYVIEEYKGDKFSLYSKKNKVYIKGKTPANSLAQEIPPKFVEKINYLIGKPYLTELHVLPEREKKLVKFLSRQYNLNVSHILNEKTFDSKNINDLKRLFY
ncbi:hypothetical protein [Flagellimonas meishanensis]|uniref:hypothetical protein n=1 Tax=Flagellimonas meishanensis TaxID=2873264 RepID=UPI001CA75958|nr:hypothetical protein [[Muricauda] meishanensis]